MLQVKASRAGYSPHSPRYKFQGNFSSACPCARYTMPPSIIYIVGSLNYPRQAAFSTRQPWADISNLVPGLMAAAKIFMIDLALIGLAFMASIFLLALNIHRYKESLKTPMTRR